MRITSSTVFVAHCDNILGKQALCILQAKGQKTRMLCGGDLPAIPDVVVFVTTDQVRYSSRYLRLLPADAKGRRANEELLRLIERMPWLQRSAMIVCVNPSRANAPGGSLADLPDQPHLTGFVQAIEQLLRYDAVRVSSPKRPDRGSRLAAKAEKRENLRDGGSLGL